MGGKGPCRFARGEGYRGAGVFVSAVYVEDRARADDLWLAIGEDPAHLRDLDSISHAAISSSNTPIGEYSCSTLDLWGCSPPAFSLGASAWAKVKTRASSSRSGSSLSMSSLDISCMQSWRLRV